VIGAPNEFKANDVFRYRATGTIHTSALPWDNYSPDGRTGDSAPNNDPAWPGPSLTKFSLVGGFGSDRASIQLGTGGPGGTGNWYCIQVPRDTYLRLAINDNMTNDNSGRWDISIDRYHN
jgi:hypothetical protein